MRVKLHNKYEITIGDETKTFYNTLTKSVFTKIKALQPYNGYFAFGTGTQTPTFSDANLASYVASYATTTEEVQADIKKGDMFVKKVKVFGENEANGLTFSEIGLTDSNESNPTIYNHIVLTDENDDPITITKPAGEEMVVRLTIFLDVESSSTANLIAGNNKLVKAILGEDCLTNKNFVITKGTNEQPNEPIYRDALASYTSYTYDSLIYNLTDDEGFSNELTIDFGTGELKEALVLLDGEPVIRFNCMGVRPAISTTEEFDKNINNTITIGKDVQSVLSVTDSDDASIENYVTNSYAEMLSDKVVNPFSYPFDNQTTRYVSKNGEYIAFILNSTFYLYKNDNLLLKQIETDAIDLSELDFDKLIIVDDYLFFVGNTSPYVSAFVVMSGKCFEVSITSGNGFSGSLDFDLNQLEVTITKANSVRIAGINSQTYGICYIGSFNGKTNIEINSMLTTSHYNFKKVVCLYKNSFTDSVVYYLSDSVNGSQDVYYIESVTKDGTLSTNNSHGVAYDFFVNSSSVHSCGRVIYSVKTNNNGSSLLNAYYYPEERRYNIPYTNETDIWVSPDFNYCVKKFSSTNYKIYNLIGFSNPNEFSVGFGSLDQSTFLDFQFLKDTLLIFTSDENEPIVAKNLGAYCAVIEGLDDDSSETMVVNYLKYNVLGSLHNENVEGKLTLTISGFES